MLLRSMRELGRLLLRLWAEQAICASGRIPGQEASRRACGLASGRRDALAG